MFYRYNIEHYYDCNTYMLTVKCASWCRRYWIVTIAPVVRVLARCTNFPHFFEETLCVTLVPNKGMVGSCIWKPLNGQSVCNYNPWNRVPQRGSVCNSYVCWLLSVRVVWPILGCHYSSAVRVLARFAKNLGSTPGSGTKFSPLFKEALCVTSLWSKYKEAYGKLYMPVNFSSFFNYPSYFQTYIVRLEVQ